jgi:hypothetical protein
MGFVAFGVALALLGVLGAAASLNGKRFGERVARDASRLLTAPTTPRQLEGFETLPAPVRCYLTKALGRRHAVCAVRLRHAGSFRTSLDGGWLPIRGEQYFATDPPGFVWWGRVRVAPGVWVDAHDRSVAAAGSMFVAFESTLTLADRAGLELDQSAMLRLLGEMVWFPTALADERYVTWTAIDDRRARATLRINGHEASGIFELGDDDLPRSFRADRYRDVGDGKSVLTPFIGEYADYREQNGLLVPHRVNGYWELGAQPLLFARFELRKLEYDRAEPFPRSGRARDRAP